MAARLPSVSFTYRHRKPVKVTQHGSDSDISSDDDFKPKPSDNEVKSVASIQTKPNSQSPLKPVNKSTNHLNAKSSLKAVSKPTIEPTIKATNLPNIKKSIETDTIKPSPIEPVIPPKKLSYLDFLEPDDFPLETSSTFKEVFFPMKEVPLSAKSPIKNQLQSNQTQLHSKTKNQLDINSDSDNMDLCLTEPKTQFTMRFPAFKQSTSTKNTTTNYFNRSNSDQNYNQTRNQEKDDGTESIKKFPKLNSGPTKSSQPLKRHASSKSDSKCNGARNLPRTSSYGNDRVELSEDSDCVEVTKPKKKRPEKLVKLTPYEIQLKEEVQQYHDQVSSILSSFSFQQPTSKRYTSIIELITNISTPDFVLKMQTYQHFEPLLEGLIQDLLKRSSKLDPVLELGILAFTCVVSKDNVHAEILLEFDYLITYFITCLKDLNSNTVESIVSNNKLMDDAQQKILDRVLAIDTFKHNSFSPTKPLLATQCLIQIAEAGGRRLKKLQSFLLKQDGISIIIRELLGIIKLMDHTENTTYTDLTSCLVISLLQLLTYVTHEKNERTIRSKVIGSFPELIPTLLKTLQKTQVNTGGVKIMECLSKLLLDLTNHHLDAILQVGNTIPIIVSKMMLIQNTSQAEDNKDLDSSMFKAEPALLPMSALLINLLETPHLSHLKHLPPLFIDLGAFSKHKSLTDTAFNSNTPLLVLTELFVIYSNIESHESWTLAGYLATLISFILLGLHNHNTFCLSEYQLLDFSSTLSLADFSVTQIIKKLPDRQWTYLVEFLTQFKNLTSKISYNLNPFNGPKIVEDTITDVNSPELYYSTPTLSISETLEMLLDHISVYNN